MSKINKIKLSGTTYDVEDANASKTVELTQAQYDALVSGGTVDPNTFYIITDAQSVDISEYWTSGQTQSAIDSAVSGKQDTLIAGENIAISGNVISATGGGSITIDPTLDSGSTNAVANSAITDAVTAKEYPIEGALSAKHFWDDENMGYYTEISDSTSIKVPNSTLLSYPYIAYAFASDSEFMGGGCGYIATVSNGSITSIDLLNGSSISSLTVTYDANYTYFTPSGGTFSGDSIGVIAVMGMDYEPTSFMDLGWTASENGADVGIISVVGSISAETLVNRVNRIYDDVSRLQTFNPIADTITLNDNDGNGRNNDGVGYGILNYNTYNPLTDTTASGHTADIFKYSSIDFKGENNVLTFNGSAISMTALKNRSAKATISEFTDGSSATTDQWSSIFGYDTCFIINANSASSGGSNQSMRIEISGPNNKSGEIQLQLNDSNGLTVQISYNGNSVSKTIKPFVLGNSYIIDTRKAGGWGDEVGIHTLTVSNMQGSDFISSIKFYDTYNATIPIADIAADVAAGTYATKTEMFDELSHLAREEEVNFYDYGSPSAVTISTGYTNIYDFYGIVISGFSSGFYIQVVTDDAIGNFVDGLSFNNDGSFTSTKFPDEPIPYYLDDELTKFENGVWNIYFAEGTKVQYLSINTSTEASAVIYKSFTETPIKDAVSSIQNSLSGYVETSSITSAVTSASTDSEIPTAKAVYDAIPTGGTGGGKAISAGTNISVTTGETADTINCTIPAFFHRNTIKGDIDIGSNEGISSDYGRLVIGRRVQSRGNPYFQYSIGIGVQPDNSNNYCQLYGQNSVGIGRGFKIGSDSLYANGINNAIAIGHNATSRNNGDIALGADATASGNSSVAIGSGATADGAEYKMNLNNQIKVTPSNQVYIYNKDNTEMICLQDQLGGGGSSYSAGTGIDITNDVISVTGMVATSAITTSITSSSTDAQVPSAKAVYDIVGDIETLLSQI